MKKSQVLKSVFYILIPLISLTGCNNKGANKTSHYQPVFSHDTLGENALTIGFPNFSYTETAEPLVNYLNENLTGTHVKITACISWEEYLKYLNQNKFDIIIVNGMVAIEAARHGYSIMGKIINDTEYTSVIFTRKDANIREATDLKGKPVALVPSRVIPGTMMPMYYLYQHGLDVNTSIRKIPVSSFEAAIISTYLDKSVAGLCLKRNWNVYIKDHPEILSKVDIKWETPALTHNALVIKNTVDKKIVSQLLDVFFSINKTKAGKAALERLDIAGFEKANNSTYKMMMDFKRKYESVIL